MKYSIIVPCYKCESTIDRLLKSVVDQKENDLEVILVNDEEGFNIEKIVKKYSKKLNIRAISTEFQYHNPGNTRNYGIDAANGDWIVFIDCDDSLRLDALKYFSEAINVAPLAVLHFAKIKQWHPDGTEFSDLEDYQAKHWVWLHGKCYKREFINKHNIRFPKDMKTCEDYWFNYMVRAHLSNDGAVYTDINHFVYNWLWNDNSLSRSDIYVLSLRAHFYDHIKASLFPWLSIENTSNSVDVQTVYLFFLLYLFYDYFLYQYYKSKCIYFKEDLVKEAMSKVNEVFGLTVFDIINDVESNPQRWFKNYNDTVKSFTHEEFVCPESFRTNKFLMCK